MFNKSSSYGGGARRLTEQPVAYSVLSVDELATQIEAEFQEEGVTPTIPCEWIAMAELAGLTVDPVSGQITGTEEESLANVLVKMSPELFLTDQGVK